MAAPIRTQALKNALKMKAPCHPVLRKTYHVPLEKNPGLLPGVCILPHPPAHTGSLWFTQRLSPGNHTASHTVPKETEAQGRSLAYPRSRASEGWHWSLGLGDVHCAAFSVLSYLVSKGMGGIWLPEWLQGASADKHRALIYSGLLTAY